MTEEIIAQSGPVAALLWGALVVMAGVVVVLWRAILRKDKRLTEVHDRGTDALNANTAVLQDLKTILLMSERKQ